MPLTWIVHPSTLEFENLGPIERVALRDLCLPLLPREVKVRKPLGELLEIVRNHPAFIVWWEAAQHNQPSDVDPEDLTWFFPLKALLSIAYQAAPGDPIKVITKGPVKGLPQQAFYWAAVRGTVSSVFGEDGTCFGVFDTYHFEDYK